MVTLKDIADRLGLSTAAVSKALRGSKKISEKTRKEVIRTAKELGYVRSAAASSLSTGITNNIAFIYNQGKRTRPFFQDEIYARVFNGIEQVVTSNGYHLFVKLTKGKVDDSIYFDQQVAGIIYAGEISDNIIKAIKKRNIPFVIAGNASIDNFGVDLVVPDVFPGVLKAIDYLFDLGHRRVAIVTVEERSHCSTELENAYKTSLQKYSMVSNKKYVQLSKQPENGYDGMVALMQLEDRPTAVIFYNDKMALGALEAARELDIRVPDDVSLIGFHNTELMQLCRPKMTILDYDSFELGQRAISLLMDKIKKKTSGIAKVLLPISLIKGESCGKAP